MKQVINGIETRLVYRNNKTEELDIGDSVVDECTNVVYTLVGGAPPHKAGSTGRVLVRSSPVMGNTCHEYFPSVIDAEWFPHPYR